MLWKCLGKCDDGGTYTPTSMCQGWRPLTSLNDLPGSTVITIPGCILALYVSLVIQAMTRCRNSRCMSIEVT